MTVDDLVKSVTQMSPEEITERLRVIRHSRGMQKEVTVTKRPTAIKEKSSDNIADTLKNMSVEQLQQLAMMLEDKK